MTKKTKTNSEMQSKVHKTRLGPGDTRYTYICEPMPGVVYISGYFPEKIMLEMMSSEIAAGGTAAVFDFTHSICCTWAQQAGIPYLDQSKFLLMMPDDTDMDPMLPIFMKHGISVVGLTGFYGYSYVVPEKKKNVPTHRQMKEPRHIHCPKWEALAPHIPLLGGDTKIIVIVSTRCD